MLDPNNSAARDTFTSAYLTCTLWSSTDGDGVHLDRNYCKGDICPHCRQSMAEDCESFLDAAWNMIAHNVPRLLHAATDFWLTRNRHGSGFWDGDWEEHGRALTDLAHPYGECDLYIGDDGCVHVQGVDHSRPLVECEGESDYAHYDQVG